MDDEHRGFSVELEEEEMILNHVKVTGSKTAEEVLKNWDACVSKFVKVIPKEYKRVTERIADYMQDGCSKEEAAIRVFEEGHA